MAVIDLLVLGILKKETLSAYDIQKSVEKQNLSRWVKISIPSIYKKVIQLEKKGFVKSASVKPGKMPEKAVYFLTAAGDAEFRKLMLKISSSPIHMLLDLNAVILNLDKLPPELRRQCLSGIEENIKALKSYLENSIQSQKDRPGSSEPYLLVLHQQYALAQAMETWLMSVK